MFNNSIFENLLLSMNVKFSVKFQLFFECEILNKKHINNGLLYQ